MAKKKPIRKVTATPKRKTPTSKSKKTRKPNRYNKIRSASAAYCREKYGKPCTNDELNKIYRELKKGYKEVPYKEVIKNLDLLLAPKSKGLPDYLKGFMWFDTESLIFNASKNYFKPTDKLVLNMSEVNLKPVNTTIEDLPTDYREKVYSQLRKITTYSEEKLGETLYTQFLFNKKKSKTTGKNRKFVWDLDSGTSENIDFKAALDTPDATKQSKPKVIPQKGLKSDELELAKLKAEANKERRDELSELKQDYKDGMFTLEEYKEERKTIMSKYNKGGIV